MHYSKNIDKKIAKTLLIVTLLFLSYGVVQSKAPQQVIAIEESNSLSDQWDTTLGVSPEFLQFSADLGREILLSGSVFLYSNVTANYSAQVNSGGARVARLANSNGLTNDSIRVIVDPSLAPDAGFYSDTITFLIEGYFDTVRLIVNLEINDPPPPDTSYDNYTLVVKYKRVSVVNQFPNPFNPETQISFSLNKSAYILLEIYDVLGRRVKTLSSAQYPPGTHRFFWQGKTDVGIQVASGTYFYLLQVDSEEYTGKMLLLK